MVTGKIYSFTFIEVLFVIIIIAVLVGVSLPNMRRTFNNLQLNSFSRQLQAFMVYLRERSIVEGKIIYLNIDNQKRQYWAQIKDNESRLRTFSLPVEITIETEKEQILFYPDGSIEQITLKIFNLDGQSITLTTKGIFGGVKLQTQG